MQITNRAHVPVEIIKAGDFSGSWDAFGVNHPLKSAKCSISNYPTNEPLQYPEEFGRNNSEIQHTAYITLILKVTPNVTSILH